MVYVACSCWLVRRYAVFDSARVEGLMDAEQEAFREAGPSLRRSQDDAMCRYRQSWKWTMPSP